MRKENWGGITANPVDKHQSNPSLAPMAAATKRIDFSFNFATQQVECAVENTICNGDDSWTFSGEASAKSVTFVETFTKGYPAGGSFEVVLGAFAGNETTVGQSAQEGATIAESYAFSGPLEETYAFDMHFDDSSKHMAMKMMMENYKMMCAMGHEHEAQHQMMNWMEAMHMDMHDVHHMMEDMARREMMDKEEMDQKYWDEELKKAEVMKKTMMDAEQAAMDQAKADHQAAHLSGKAHTHAWAEEHKEEMRMSKEMQDRMMGDHMEHGHKNSHMEDHMMMDDMMDGCGMMSMMMGDMMCNGATSMMAYAAPLAAAIAVAAF